jgi:sugar phosphate isomerase/epimerase
MLTPSSRQIPLAVASMALSEDSRAAAAAAHEAGFNGLQFDAAAGGFDLTALSQTGRREFLQMLRQQDEPLASLRADAGAKGLSAGADVDRLLWRWDKILATAAGLGTPLVCVELGALGSAEFVDAALAELGRRADRYGVVMALRSELSPVESLHRALTAAACPWFGIDLDPAALLREEWTAAQAFDRLGTLTRHVRGRDALRGENHRTRPTVIGKGSVDWPQLLQLLDDAGFKGWISIDPLELTDRRAGAIAGLRFLKSI